MTSKIDYDAEFKHDDSARTLGLKPSKIGDVDKVNNYMIISTTEVFAG